MKIWNKQEGAWLEIGEGIVLARQEGGKKVKKKGVELVLDEERGEVVGRKKHKRGEDFGEDW